MLLSANAVLAQFPCTVHNNWQLKLSLPIVSTFTKQVYGEIFKINKGHTKIPQESTLDHMVVTVLHWCVYCKRVHTLSRSALA